MICMIWWYDMIWYDTHFCTLLYSPSKWLIFCPSFTIQIWIFCQLFWIHCYIYVHHFIINKLNSKISYLKQSLLSLCYIVQFHILTFCNVCLILFSLSCYYKYVEINLLRSNICTFTWCAWDVLTFCSNAKLYWIIRNPRIKTVKLSVTGFDDQVLQCGRLFVIV
jgi:hypothetical protein